MYSKHVSLFGFVFNLRKCLSNNMVSKHGEENMISTTEQTPIEQVCSLKFHRLLFNLNMY